MVGMITGVVCVTCVLEIRRVNTPGKYITPETGNRCRKGAGELTHGGGGSGGCEGVGALCGGGRKEWEVGWTDRISGW